MGVLSNRISREDLQAGDHVYSWRTAYTYAHHGIYVGDNEVIHFTQGRVEGESSKFIDMLLISSSRSHTTRKCETCNPQEDSHGVICSCLDCFLDGGVLYRFEYGVSVAFFLAKARGGTCTLAESDPPKIVVHRATNLLQKGFGSYHVFKKNCEDFAIYCKTGLVVIGDNVGRSGQATSINAAIKTVPSSLRFQTASIHGMIYACGLYCIWRLATDIAFRKDVTKVPVENLTETQFK